jgi:multidrug efflux pump subunit AcrA (membrane-fusion protein)
LRAQRLKEEEEAVLRQGIAQVQLNSALAPRERKRIRTPFDGVVTDRLISVGERYNEPAPMLVVARIDPLHIEAYLPAAQRSTAAHRQSAKIIPKAGGTPQAVINVIDPVLDAATGTYGARLALTSPDGAFYGQRVTLRF